MKNFANIVDPNIQIATLNDSDFILNCSHLLQADGRKQDPRLPDVPVDCYDESFLNIMAGNDPNAIIFRYSDCGFMCVLVKNPQKALHILSLYILPEYRGQSIGTKLISYLKDFRDKHYPDYVISLKCLSRNKAAQSFYEGNDFTATYKDSWRRIYEYPINQNLKNFSNITRKYYSHREV